MRCLLCSRYPIHGGKYEMDPVLVKMQRHYTYPNRLMHPPRTGNQTFAGYDKSRQLNAYFQSGTASKPLSGNGPAVLLLPIFSPTGERPARIPVPLSPPYGFARVCRHGTFSRFSERESQIPPQERLAPDKG